MKKVLAIMLFLATAVFVRAEEAQLPDADANKEGDIIRAVAIQRRDNAVMTLDLNKFDKISIEDVKERLASLPAAAPLIESLKEQFGDTIENKLRHIQFSASLHDPKKRKISIIGVIEMRTPITDEDMDKGFEEATDNIDITVAPAELIPGTRAFKISFNSVQENDEAAGQNAEPATPPMEDWLVVRLKNPRFLVSGTEKAVTKMLNDLEAGSTTSANRDLTALLERTRGEDYPLSFVYSLLDAKRQDAFQQMIAQIGAQNSELGNLLNICHGAAIKFAAPEKNTCSIYLGVVFSKHEEAELAKTILYDGLILGALRFITLQYTNNQPLPLFDSMVSSVRDNVAELKFQVTNEDVEIIKPLIPEEIPTINND